MITNDPNTNLIEAMKEKLPLKGKLADMLMDTLYIGKEAVYRRLRGEVPFTLQEAALVSILTLKVKQRMVTHCSYLCVVYQF